MLLNTDTELSQHFPSSVIKSVKNLRSLVERAEDIHLKPVLGKPLYKHLINLYKEAVEQKTELSVSSEDTTIRFISLCQSAVTYFAMADSADIITVSLNIGAGLSVVSTDGYNPADEKEKDRFSNKCWSSAWKDVDRIVELLEEDAKSEASIFCDLWKESEWFYFQGDLLLTTAKETEKYLTAEEKRTFDRKRFVEMQGDLRFCQMSFISKAIGDDFLEWFVQYNYTATVPTANGEETEAPVPDADASVINDKVVRKTKELLSMALMAAMRYRRDHRGADENDANLALFRATEYIKQHQDDFGEIIKTSHLYTPPKTEKEETHCHGHRKHKRVASCQCLEGGDALFVPFM